MGEPTWERKPAWKKGSIILLHKVVLDDRWSIEKEKQEKKGKKKKKPQKGLAEIKEGFIYCKTFAKGRHWKAIEDKLEDNHEWKTKAADTHTQRKSKEKWRVSLKLCFLFFRLIYIRYTFRPRKNTILLD